MYGASIASAVDRKHKNVFAFKAGTRVIEHRISRHRSGAISWRRGDQDGMNLGSPERSPHNDTASATIGGDVGIGLDVPDEPPIRHPTSGLRSSAEPTQQERQYEYRAHDRPPETASLAQRRVSVNRLLTIKWANIAGGRGNHPPRRSTPAPAVVPASGLMT
jgi:hypothetical protein